MECPGYRNPSAYASQGNAETFGGVKDKSRVRIELHRKAVPAGIRQFYSGNQSRASAYSESCRTISPACNWSLRNLADASVVSTQPMAAPKDIGAFRIPVLNVTPPPTSARNGNDDREQIIKSGRTCRVSPAPHHPCVTLHHAPFSNNSNLSSIPQSSASSSRCSSASVSITRQLAFESNRLKAQREITVNIAARWVKPSVLGKLALFACFVIFLTAVLYFWNKNQELDERLKQKHQDEKRSVVL